MTPIRCTTCGHAELLHKGGYPPDACRVFNCGCRKFNAVRGIQPSSLTPQDIQQLLNPRSAAGKRLRRIPRKNRDKETPVYAVPETTLGAENIEGIRIFRIDINKLRLTSLIASSPVINRANYPAWEPGKDAISVCKFAKAHGHMKPAFNCTCGIWICKSRKNLETSIGTTRSGHTYTHRQYPTCSARVQGWGTIIEHELGWRVEYARIIPETIALYPRLENRKKHVALIQKLREVYTVERG